MDPYSRDVVPARKGSLAYCLRAWVKGETDYIVVKPRKGRGGASLSNQSNPQGIVITTATRAGASSGEEGDPGEDGVETVAAGGEPVSLSGGASTSGSCGSGGSSACAGTDLAAELLETSAGGGPFAARSQRRGAVDTPVCEDITFIRLSCPA